MHPPCEYARARKTQSSAAARQGHLAEPLPPAVSVLVYQRLANACQRGVCVRSPIAPWALEGPARWKGGPPTRRSRGALWLSSLPLRRVRRPYRGRSPSCASRRHHRGGRASSIACTAARSGLRSASIPRPGLISSRMTLKAKSPSHGKACWRGVNIRQPSNNSLGVCPVSCGNVLAYVQIIYALRANSRMMAAWRLRRNIARRPSERRPARTARSAGIHVGMRSRWRVLRARL